MLAPYCGAIFAAENVTCARENPLIKPESADAFPPLLSAAAAAHPEDTTGFASAGTVSVKLTLCSSPICCVRLPSLHVLM